MVTLVALELMAAVLLIVRMRTSGPIERRQIGWFAYAVAVYLVIATFNVLVNPLGTEGAFLLIDALGFILIPAAIGIGIFKYRLYDIDTIVNRSVTYGLLALFIGAVYVGIVVGVGAIFTGDGSSLGLSMVATVLVAIAFQPVRVRVQRWANRLVYGERATPYEVLTRFSRRSAELSDSELMERIPQLIVDGTGAKRAALWVATADGFRTVSMWPEGSEPRHLIGDGSFPDLEADYSVPIFHDGDLLGGMSLLKEAGETITPADEELVNDLAGAMGLALRNVRLTEELRKHVADLEASRERVLAAADEARRALEQSLDSGPQQELVALKVKLGPTRKLAERAGAEKTAKVLEQLEADAGSAIQVVRDLAAGIYPPLLEAEGLLAAITQQTQKAAIPVAVHGYDVGRFSRDIEAAVYFSVLEALQNTAKYANAESASVSLTGTGGDLLFQVRDDGNGFDAASIKRGAGLNGMADRLDTVGGTISIDSEPGTGTVVRGSVPATAPITSGAT